MYEQHIQNQV